MPYYIPRTTSSHLQTKHTFFSPNNCYNSFVRLKQALKIQTRYSKIRTIRSMTILTPKYQGRGKRIQCTSVLAYIPVNKTTLKHKDLFQFPKPMLNKKQGEVTPTLGKQKQEVDSWCSLASQPSLCRKTQRWFTPVVGVLM